MSWPTSNPFEHAAVTRALAETCGPVIVELGAYDGSDTVILYDNLKPSRMVAVEPDPRAYQNLCNRVGSRNILLLPYAVGSFIGETVLYLSDPPGSSSLRRPKLHLHMFPEVRFTSVVTVMVTTLDSLFYQMNVPRVDLLWCDVQGAERDVIIRGEYCLRHTRFALLECDMVELYEGQLTRDRLLDLLPGWEVVEEWPDQGNVFLRNTRL